MAGLLLLISQGGGAGSCLAANWQKVGVRASLLDPIFALSSHGCHPEHFKHCLLPFSLSSVSFFSFDSIRLQFYSFIPPQLSRQRSNHTVSLSIKHSCVSGVGQSRHSMSLRRNTWRNPRCAAPLVLGGDHHSRCYSALLAAHAFDRSVFIGRGPQIRSLCI